MLTKQNNNEEIIRLGKLYSNLRDWSVFDKEGICVTLTAAMGGGGGHVPMIIEEISPNESKISLGSKLANN